MTEKRPQPEQELPHPDCLYLEAAHGWLLLGLPQDSLGELERISTEHLLRLPVLDCRYDVLAACKSWEESLEVAEQILGHCPDSPSGWVKQSYSLHELNRTMEARESLMEAEPHFPGEWLIPYNLACYACQMGDESACVNWLEKAAKRGEPKRILVIAMQDEDLRAVRARLPAILRARD